MLLTEVRTTSKIPMNLMGVLEIGNSIKPKSKIKRIIPLYSSLNSQLTRGERYHTGTSSFKVKAYLVPVSKSALIATPSPCLLSVEAIIAAMYCTVCHLLGLHCSQFPKFPYTSWIVWGGSPWRLDLVFFRSFL